MFLLESLLAVDGEGWGDICGNGVCESSAKGAREGGGSGRGYLWWILREGIAGDIWEIKFGDMLRYIWSM
jgi:hypothetical protein